MGATRLARVALYLLPLALLTRGDLARADTAVLDLRPHAAADRETTVRNLWSELQNHGAKLALPKTLHAIADLPFTPSLLEAQQRAEQTLVAANQGHCDASERLADSSLLMLASAQSVGAEVTADLMKVYSAVLLCADTKGDGNRATKAADQLQRIDGGNTSALRKKYPSVDATANVMNAELTTTGQPGELVYIDFQPTQRSPLTTIVTQGEHIVAAGGSAQRVNVTGWTKQIALKQRDGDDLWLRQKAVAFRSSSARLDAISLYVVMERANLQSLLVWRENGTMLVWQRKNGRAALVSGARDSKHAAQLIEQKNDQPRFPFLVDVRKSHATPSYTSEENDSSNEWWIYAGIGGAVTAAAAIILFVDFDSQDRQTFDITVP